MDLTLKEGKDAFKSLLTLDDTNVGLTASLKTVQDGVGNSSPLQLSTASVNINGTMTAADLTTVSSWAVSSINNGTFDTNITNWTGTGWAWDAAGVAKHSSGTTALSQAAATVVIGSRYKVVYDVTFAGTGSVTMSAGGISGVPITATTASVTQMVVPIATTALAFTPTTGFTGSIDNVTMQLMSDGDLTLGGKIVSGVTDKAVRFLANMTDPSANEVAVRIDYTTNKSGSLAANDTGLLISGTDTASPGTSLGIDYQVGGASKFRCDSAGAVTSASGFTAATNYAFLAGSAASLGGNAAAGLVSLRDTGGIAWSSSNLAGGVKDTGLIRDSAGVLHVTDGSTGTGVINTAGTIITGPAGSTSTSSYLSEQLTLSTGAATTATVTNLAPASSRIKAIVGRVTTTITTAASYAVGVTGGTAYNLIGTAGSSITGLTAGSTFVLVPAAWADQYVTTATTLTVICNTTPGAGVVRLTVYYESFTAPTS